MPKQKPTIFQKLKIAYWLMIRKAGFGLIETCGVCGSMKMVIRGSINQNKRIYRAKYKCLSCGSRANVKEKWRATKNA